MKRIRNDDKLTIYEHPPDIKDKGSILSELRLHRTFFSRQFHCMLIGVIRRFKY